MALIRSGANIQDRYGGTVERDSHIPKKNKLANHLQITGQMQQRNNDTSNPFQGDKGDVFSLICENYVVPEDTEETRTRRRGRNPKILGCYLSSTSPHPPPGYVGCSCDVPP